MKIISYLLAACALLTACSSGGLKEPTAAERSKALAQTKTHLAMEYMRAQDYRQAIAAAEDAIKSDNRYVYAWLMRAQIYQQLKVADKADEYFRHALNLEPNNAEVNNNYGWFLCDLMQRPNDAMAYFDRALADPTYPNPEVANMNKGICSGRMGQYGLAKAYFERAIAAAPWFYPVQKEMARNELASGNVQNADYLFRQYQSRVNALNADDLLLGWKIARAMGKGQAAYEYEAQLRTLYPYSPELEQISTGTGTAP
ncbi:type IV pilus biogenesis/stability protein PilW [Stenoxybacter acetivorans]|uniref:type IV pilus biogenesis/stability protein PilW n=1 Tax=Stenoxybacter acetivorans TaxID=422441 RepID=UPI00055D820E|nr:type IV pilus biogenesis/stability protein PilW [Stenoxybacter acetivorans]